MGLCRGRVVAVGMCNNVCGAVGEGKEVGAVIVRSLVRPFVRFAARERSQEDVTGLRSVGRW
jgi:hypothetical protein